MEIALPWFDSKLNPNSAVHWAVKAKLKKAQKKEAYYLALMTNAPRKADIYSLEIIFYPPCNRPRDLDNCLAAMKSSLDGLAQAWKINDKDFMYKSIEFGEVVKKGMVLIRINEND